jgi:hypothetical protein
MPYVIQVLAAILIGVAIGSILGPRQSLPLIGALAAIVLALVALFTGGWIWLAIGTVIFLAVQCVPTAAIRH